MIDFKGMSTDQGLFFDKKSENCVLSMYIFTFFLEIFAHGPMEYV